MPAFYALRFHTFIRKYLTVASAKKCAIIACMRNRAEKLRAVGEVLEVDNHSSLTPIAKVIFRGVNGDREVDIPTRKLRRVIPDRDFVMPGDHFVATINPADENLSPRKFRRFKGKTIQKA